MEGERERGGESCGVAVDGGGLLVIGEGCRIKALDTIHATV